MTHHCGDIAAYSGYKVTVRQSARDGSWVNVKAEGWKHGKRVKPSDLGPWIEPQAPSIEEERFQFIKPICDRCRFATAKLCPYLGLSDIEKGLAVVGAKAVSTQLSGITAYKVIRCPEYKQGKLPSLAGHPGAGKGLMRLCISPATP